MKKDLKVVERPLREKPVGVKVVELFTELYHTKTHYPYKAEKKDYIIASNLARNYGVHVVLDKIRTLAVMCEHKASWFARNGWADFTLGQISVHWNRILMDGVHNKEIDDRVETEKIRAKIRGLRERTDKAIESYGT